ncbi:hypothetical protein EJ04DRAFT_568389 [Polyplosphaeria fusca]|uniref:Uncharacterized protein n=1 Tax=Polyplosphaeria fusca TaxID=682080 RepID=A0A9P4QRQ6_9PLEO|nr:hypothetical protein EJ04DRAFT_568389 [Polyplosphaeria fusca]
MSNPMQPHVYRSDADPGGSMATIPRRADTSQVTRKQLWCISLVLYSSDEKRERFLRWLALTPDGVYTAAYLRALYALFKSNMSVIFESELALDNAIVCYAQNDCRSLCRYVMDKLPSELREEVYGYLIVREQEDRPYVSDYSRWQWGAPLSRMITQPFTMIHIGDAAFVGEMMIRELCASWYRRTTFVIYGTVIDIQNQVWRLQNWNRWSVALDPKAFMMKIIFRWEIGWMALLYGTRGPQWGSYILHVLLRRFECVLALPANSWIIVDWAAGPSWGQSRYRDAFDANSREAFYVFLGFLSRLRHRGYRVGMKIDKMEFTWNNGGRIVWINRGRIPGP